MTTTIQPTNQQQRQYTNKPTTTTTNQRQRQQTNDNTNTPIHPYTAATLTGPFRWASGATTSKLRPSNLNNEPSVPPATAQSPLKRWQYLSQYGLETRQQHGGTSNSPLTYPTHIIVVNGTSFSSPKMPISVSTLRPRTT